MMSLLRSPGFAWVGTSVVLGCGSGSSTGVDAGGDKVQWCHTITVQPAVQGNGNVATDICDEYFSATPAACSGTPGQCPASDAGPLVGCCKSPANEPLPGDYSAICYFSDFASPAYKSGCTNPSGTAIAGTWQTTVP
jgi:hypothetical protein